MEQKIFNLMFTEKMDNKSILSETGIKIKIISTEEHIYGK